MPTSSRQNLLDVLAGTSFTPETLTLELLQLDPHDLRNLLLSILRTLRTRGLLLELAGEISPELELPPLIDHASRTVSRILGAELTRVYLLDSRRSQVWTRDGSGAGSVERTLPLAGGPLARIVVEGEMVALEGEMDEEAAAAVGEAGHAVSSLLGAPIRAPSGAIIGGLLCRNKRSGRFGEQDRGLLERIAPLVGLSLNNALLHEQVRNGERRLQSLLNVTTAMTAQLDLTTLIQTIMAKASEILDAERASLFILDSKRGELWSKVSQGVAEIRFPSDRGIAGHVATTGETLNIPDVYAHPLFNPEIDRKTGYRTRTLLCAPMRNSKAETTGVTQIINKRVGPFSEEDESLLNAFSGQAAIAVENAQLYQRTLHLKNYLSSILQNLSNGVLTLDPDGVVTTANEAAQRTLELPADCVGRSLASLYEGRNALVDLFDQVLRGGGKVVEYDADHLSTRGTPISVNLTIEPLMDQGTSAKLGAVAILEDMTKEKRQRSMLSRFLSKDVAARLLNEDFQSVMKGSLMDVTMLFSDIRSFTTITESNSAVKVVDLLNAYFSEMVDSVFSNGGTLDKYIGDAIMAIFGAPIPDPGSPLKAARAALRMQQDLERFNQRRIKAGEFPIRIGIGLATGDVVCGAIGSDKKLEYTAIGDAVNLASRLEGANKVYGTTIIASESTYQRIRTDVRARRLDCVRVKGKERAVTVFELLGLVGEPMPDQAEQHLSHFEHALARFDERDFAGAREQFGRARDARPTDRATELWIERMDQLSAVPPPADWDGSFQFTEK